MRVYMGIDPSDKGGVAYVMGDKLVAQAWPEGEVEIYDALRHVCSQTQDTVCVMADRVSRYREVIRGMLIAMGVPFRMVHGAEWRTGVLRVQGYSDAMLLAEHCAKTWEDGEA